MESQDTQHQNTTNTLENQFLAAWTDSVAGVTCFSNSILTEDLFGDGHRLLIAGEDSQLKARPITASFQFR